MPLSAFLDGTPHTTFDRAINFIGWLKKTGQNAWVMLPLSETQLQKGSTQKHVASPYKGYGIGLDPRYLPPKDAAYEEKWMKNNDYWLGTYSLFCALRDHFKTDDWREWPPDIRDYEQEAITAWTVRLEKKIEHHKRRQYALHAAYQLLKKHAKKNKIILIGDVPFYVSLHSPLVWANQGLFEIGEGGKLTKVSGILWGHFDKQVWGHPLYKWGNSLQRGKVMELWKMRLRYHSTLFDKVRIDHVKGFFKFGVIDLTNARRDRYEFGPGEKVLGQLLEYSKNIGLKIFVEDSGHYKLKMFLKVVKKLSLAGMKIYRFAYNEKKHTLNKEYADISHYPENSIVYTSTHDTESLLGYLALLKPEAKRMLAVHAGIEFKDDDKIFAKAIRDAIIASPANFVIVPIQDWLLTKDRINTPGTESEANDPNWRFRLSIPIEDLPTRL